MSETVVPSWQDVAERYCAALDAAQAENARLRGALQRVVDNAPKYPEMGPQEQSLAVARAALEAK